MSFFVAMYSQRQHLSQVQKWQDKRRLTTTYALLPGAVLHSCTVLTVAAEAVKAWLADIAQQLQGERDVILLHFGLDNEATCIKLEVSGGTSGTSGCLMLRAAAVPTWGDTFTPGVLARNMPTALCSTALSGSLLPPASSLT